MERNCEKGVNRPDYLIVIRVRISGWIWVLIILGLGVWPEGAEGGNRFAAVWGGLERDLCVRVEGGGVGGVL